MSLRRFGAALVVVAVTVVWGAATASAGELNAKGERPMVKATYEFVDDEGVTHIGHILHGKSECAFSGLNDEYLAEQPTEGPASDGFGRTQSWGQLPKAVRDAIRPFAHPGMACNPTKGPPVEP